MRRMPEKKLGRPPASGVPRDVEIRVRATPAEAEQFKAVGVEAFRRWLKSAYARIAKPR